MNVFISHSSKDKEIAIALAHFLESLDKDVKVFCTALENVIKQGEDYIQAINRGLTECDMFIPLLSENYFESKYSLIELGFSYSILYLNNKKNYMFPFSIPPLNKGTALLSTPLSTIQVLEINTGIHSFVKQLKAESKLSRSYLHNNDIDSFIGEINKIILQSVDIFKHAEVLPVCSDGSRKNAIKVTKGENNEYSVTLIPMENGKYAEYPEFLSLVLKFMKKIDLYQSLKINNNAKLTFVLESFTDSLKNIDVEFKYSDPPQMLKKYTFNINSGVNDIAIQLNDMNIDGLSSISEICFVVWDDYFKEQEGSYCIRNIKINV